MPQTTDTLEAFARDLTETRQRAGRSVRQVTKVTGIPTPTLGGYFSGRHLPPINRPEVLTAVLQACQVPTEEHAGWRERLLRLYQQRRRPAATRAPYPGLRPFGVGDRDLFFGRDELLRRFRAMADEAVDSGEPVLAVVGPSGSGKSSFLRAAVQASLGTDRCGVPAR